MVKSIKLKQTAFVLLFASCTAQADFNSGFLLGYALGDNSSPVLPHSDVLKAEKALTQLPSPLQREVEKITLEILRNFQQGKTAYVHSTGVFDSAMNDWLTRSEKDPNLKAFFDYFRNKGYQIEPLKNKNNGFIIRWD